jgi:hypothetical protein
MPAEAATTRFAHLPRSRARFLLLLWLLFLAALVAASLLPAVPPPPEVTRGTPKTNLVGAETVAVLAVTSEAGFPGAVPWGALALAFPESAPDLALYRVIIRRVHDGENYYVAAQEELRKRGYPTRSVFNWRPPTYAWFFALFPEPRWIHGCLLLLSAAALALAYWGEAFHANVLQAGALLLLLIGPLGWSAVEEAFYSQEVWAGTLIVLSVAAYSARLRWLGVAAGLAALLLRELALPYVVVAGGVAFFHGRKREAIVWGIGVIAFFLILLWHAQQVTARLSAEDEKIFSEGWLRLGGLRFLLLTSRMNRYLFDAPQWLAAIFLALSLLGLAARPCEDGTRLALTVASFLFAFCFVGNPRINDYWGLLYVGLLPFGLVRLPVALRDLVHSAFTAPEPAAAEEHRAGEEFHA